MTIADNKLIALFMGGVTSTMNNNLVQGHQNIWLPIHGVCDWSTVELGRGKTLRYHKSWDWLIPVIDKIHSSNDYIEYKDSLSIFSQGVYINTKYIDITYNSVIDYIKWYNAKSK